MVALAFSLILSCVLATGALHPLSEVRLPKASLDLCQTTLAPLWAEKLDARNPELAQLYRLAWLERAGNPKMSTSEKGLRWSWRDEIWTDELADYHRHNHCSSSEHELGKLDQKVLESLLRRYIPLANEINSPHLAKQVTQYASYLTYKRKLKKSELPTLKSSSLNSCKWEALLYLNRIKSDFSDCKLPVSWLSVATWVQRGDQELLNENALKAYRFYRRAISQSKTADVELPVQVDWRRLASAALSRQADSEIMRLAYHVLVEDRSETPYVGALQRLVCQRARELGNKEYAKVMKVVFPTQASVVREAEILERCDGDLNVLRSIVKRIPGERLKSQWYGRLLAQAIKNRDSSTASLSTVYLAKKSAKISTARTVFWKTIPPHPSMKRLVQLYRKHTVWNVRQKRALKKWNKSLQEPAHREFKAENYQARGRLQLPIVLFPPDVPWRHTFRTNYYETFVEAERQS